MTRSQRSIVGALVVLCTLPTTASAQLRVGQLSSTGWFEYQGSSYRYRPSLVIGLGKTIKLPRSESGIRLTADLLPDVEADVAASPPTVTYDAGIADFGADFVFVPSLLRTRRSRVGVVFGGGQRIRAFGGSHVFLTGGGGSYRRELPVPTSTFIRTGVRGSLHLDNVNLGFESTVALRRLGRGTNGELLLLGHLGVGFDTLGAPRPSVPTRRRRATIIGALIGAPVGLIGSAMYANDLRPVCSGPGHCHLRDGTLIIVSGTLVGSALGALVGRAISISLTR